MHTVRQLDNNGVVGSSVALGPSTAEDGLEASSDSAVSWMGSEHASSPYSLDMKYTCSVDFARHQNGNPKYGTIPLGWFLSWSI
jgi:hypothetical protein